MIKTLLLATTMGLTNLVPAFAAEVSDDFLQNTRVYFTRSIRATGTNFNRNASRIR